MQNRFKEKTIVWIGGGIFAAGILASAFLIVPTPLPMYLSYGVMQGFGQGMIYTVILTTVQRWFPDRTGFASGVVVTANGLCGFFLAPLSRKLLEAEGVQKTFLIIGAVSAVMLGSIVNAGARLVLPTLADKVGRIVCIKGVLIVAVIAFVCLTLLGRNLVKEHAEKSAGVKNDTAQVSKPQAE